MLALSTIVCCLGSACAHTCTGFYVVHKQSTIFYIWQIQPKSVELVEGYGILILQKQLDAALAEAGPSPTKLIRNLTGAFFKPEVLSMSTAMGTRVRPALDKDIVSACIRKSVKDTV